MKLLQLSALAIFCISIACPRLGIGSSGDAPAIALGNDFFVGNEMTLGRQADAQEQVGEGRSIWSTTGEANVSGTWDLTDKLTDGTSYLVNGKVSVQKNSGAPGYGRVMVRFGDGKDLTTLYGQKATTVLDQTINGEVDFSAHVTYQEQQPLFGILGLDIADGDRVEISDLSFVESTPPWAIIPKKERKTVLINDVPVGHNSLREGTIPIPPGATQAHVKVTYALPEILSTMALRARASTTASKGFNVDRDIAAPQGTFFWRDGDDRDQWITFEILNPRDQVGDRFRASVNGAGITGWAAFDFEVVEGAVNELPAELPYRRPPYRLVLPETPTVKLDMATVEWDESGFKDGKPVWRTRPSHGYTQAGNGETGAYLPWTDQNRSGSEVHTRQVDKEGRPYVRLHTRKLDQPIELENRALPHQAAMLQGQHLDEWAHRRGVYSAQLLLPGRRGAWSAFWVVGRRGENNSSIWPPEIDFLESFNGAYGADYQPDTTSAGQHAGVHGSNKRENIDGFQWNVIEAGFSPDIDFFTQIHDYTTVIEEDWVTHFRDGVEFFRHRNIIEPSDGNTDWSFYPIVNVAVKDGSGGPYDEASGDMRWYGLQYYSPDSEYSLVPYTESIPYPNGEILPRPEL